jgi:hypothetical protein
VEPISALYRPGANIEFNLTGLQKVFMVRGSWWFWRETRELSKTEGGERWDGIFMGVDGSAANVT